MKKKLKLILDIIEIYTPMLTFFTLFIVFLLGIFFRYFLTPLTWTLELSLICFIWTALLGGLYAQQTDKHVRFSMFYDLFSPKVQTWFRISGNSLLMFSFILGFYPSYKYVMFMGFKKSNVLKIPMNIAFFPFVIFMAFMIGHLSWEIYSDIKLLRKK
jgi:TRAP-type C4-dicarboxylate transport system permease small subunit